VGKNGRISHVSANLLLLSGLLKVGGCLLILFVGLMVLRRR
jgi:hypothetical protein